MPNFLGALPSYVGDDDWVGDDDDMIVLGRRGRRRRPMRGIPRAPMGPSMAAASARANHVASLVRPDVPGTPARDAALLPAGFPVFSFALATGTNIVSQQMNVQTPFRGQRLTAVVIRNGTSAATSAPLISIFQVGQKPILTSPSPVPLEVFAQNAFDTNLLLPPTVPGVIYTLGINLSAALTTTDTITCVVGILGSAVL